MFSIQICGYSDDRDYETGGKSKIYYNKKFQRKLRARHSTKNVPSLPG